MTCSSTLVGPLNDKTRKTSLMNIYNDFKRIDKDCCERILNSALFKEGVLGPAPALQTAGRVVALIELECPPIRMEYRASFYFGHGMILENGLVLSIRIYDDIVSGRTLCFNLYRNRLVIDYIRTGEILGRYTYSSRTPLINEHLYDHISWL
jgi:hypothetical protein